MQVVDAYDKQQLLDYHKELHVEKELLLVDMKLQEKYKKRLRGDEQQLALQSML